MDTDGRWTIKRGRRRPPGEGEPQARVAAAIAVPVFGYKTVTDAASPNGRQLRKLLDPHQHRELGLGRHRLPFGRQRRAAGAARPDAQFQRPKPRGKPMPANLRRGNARRARVRVAIQHVLAAHNVRC